MGDIAVFDYGGESRVHRIIDVRGSGTSEEYLFKGDHNHSDDGWIPYYAVVEKVVTIHRGGQGGITDRQREQQRLTELKDAAWNAYLDAKANSDSAYEAYLEALQAYRDYMDAYCPSNTCPHGYYDQALALYHASQSAYQAYSSAYDIASVAYGEYKRAYQAYRDFADS